MREESSMITGQLVVTRTLIASCYGGVSKIVQTIFASSFLYVASAFIILIRSIRSLSAFYDEMGFFTSKYLSLSNLTDYFPNFQHSVLLQKMQMKMNKLKLEK